jgi:2-dehydropantoate 2-reductase
MTTGRSQPRIVIVGAGSIGLYLQYLLQDGKDSILIAREHSYRELRKQPLRITGSLESSLMLNCERWEAQEEGSIDVAFIATKAHELAGTLGLLGGLLSREASIYLCQNGIGIYNEAKNLLPSYKIFRASCWMGIRRLAPNHISVAGVHKLEISGPDAFRAEMERWQESFILAGLNTTISCNPVLSEWQKALWNIAVNGVCAVLDRPNGVILDNAEVYSVAEGLIDEAIAVACAEGVELTQEDKDAVFDSLRKTRTNINATLQDLRQGRHPELEYLNGAVARIARKHDQKASINETILSLVNYLDKTGARKEG